MVLTVPATLWYAILFTKGEFQNLGAKSAFIEAVVLLLALLNHSINFFIYTFSSANFRREMKLMFRIPVGSKKEKNSDTDKTNTANKATKSTGVATKASTSVSVEPKKEVAEEPPIEADPESTPPDV